MKINNKLKKHFKEGIITLAIAGITGLFAVANAHVEKYKETKAYYTESQSVVLTADEVNNIAFKEVGDYLNTLDYSEFNNTYIIYNNLKFELYDFDANAFLQYKVDSDDFYELQLDFTINKFSYLTGIHAETTTIDKPIYWYGTEIVNAFKESTITLTPTQLNDTTYSYLSEQIEDNYTNQLANSVIEYNNEYYTYDSNEESTYIRFSKENSNMKILFQYNLNDDYLYTEDNVDKFKLVDMNSELEYPFNNSITLFNASYLVDNINAPFETDDIIPAISGGLTLIGDLANEFLTGFSTLFWDSIGNKLTNFGIYSLTMLGVAITFAVIKLCLSILRRDTGA